jgi:hypothetical protein
MTNIHRDTIRHAMKPPVRFGSQSGTLNADIDRYCTSLTGDRDQFDWQNPKSVERCRREYRLFQNIVTSDLESLKKNDLSLEDKKHVLHQLFYTYDVLRGGALSGHHVQSIDQRNGLRDQEQAISKVFIAGLDKLITTKSQAEYVLNHCFGWSGCCPELQKHLIDTFKLDPPKYVPLH